MTHLVAAFAILAALQLPSGSTSLFFTAEEIDSVIYGYQRAHYCSPYLSPQKESAPTRSIVDGAEVRRSILTAAPHNSGSVGARDAADKRGLVEMWADDAELCDLAKQRDTFYDSVWRDAVRLEAIINYKAYFGPTLAGKVDLSAYAIDDGRVTKAMMDVLTTDTTTTFGAQNDDVMWWALTFLRAYEVDPTHTAYLEAARAVFERMRHTPEQHVCGGGITWGVGTHYKNAISNALYLNLAVRLAGLSALNSPDRSRYLRAALVQADWLIDRSGLWVAGGVLADGVHFQGNTCSGKPESTLWTYSQGVAINGLAHLTLLTGRQKYADRAQLLLLRVLDRAQTPKVVNGSGILGEPSTSSSTANEDAQTFKGIFAENVGYALPYFSHADRLRYGSAIAAGKIFLTINANAVWRSRTMHGGVTEFPFGWDPSSVDTAGPLNMRTTAAAIDLFNAAWSVKDLQ